jgi:hypothetical protein
MSDSAWSKLLRRLSAPSDEPPVNATENKFASLGRGAWGNTDAGNYLAGKLLEATRNPDNTYAGSAPGETLSEDSAEAARKYPNSNWSGGELVAAPVTMAANAVVPGSSLAARALVSAAGGAAHGAYTAPGGEDRLQHAAQGAVVGAGMPVAEETARSILRNIAPPQLRVIQGGAAERVPARPAAGPKSADPKNFMLPPATHEALDESLIANGLPDNRIPVEFSGKYPVNDGPTMSMQPETPAQYAVRGLEQRALARQAQGLPPGPRSVSAPPPRSSRMPTVPAEYVEAGATSRPTRAAPQSSVRQSLANLEPPPADTARSATAPKADSTLELEIPKAPRVPAEFREGIDWNAPLRDDLSEKSAMRVQFEDAQRKLNKANKIGEETARPPRKKK